MRARSTVTTKPLDYTAEVYCFQNAMQHDSVSNTVIYSVSCAHLDAEPLVPLC
jgi:hypothetical protein